jgi:ribokinase
VVRVAVAGGFGVGMTMVAPRFPGPGETLGGATFALGPGGKGSNQAVAARRLGAEVSLFTAVGSDPFAAIGRELWDREGVDTGAVKVVDAPTMVGTIIVDSTGENRIIVASGALDVLTPDDVSRFASSVRTADMCVVSLEIPVPVAVAVLRLARALGVTTLLDPAPATVLPVEVWAAVDVLTPNRVEAAMLVGCDANAPPEELADRLREVFSGVLALTLGGNGVLVDDGRDRRVVPSPKPSRVVDTTGAGDAFAGALAVAWAEGRPLCEAVRVAAAAGAHAVGIAEVVPSLPSRADLDIDALVAASVGDEAGAAASEGVRS